MQKESLGTNVAFINIASRPDWMEKTNMTIPTSTDGLSSTALLQRARSKIQRRGIMKIPNEDDDVMPRNCQRLYQIMSFVLKFCNPWPILIVCLSTELYINGFAESVLFMRMYSLFEMGWNL